MKFRAVLMLVSVYLIFPGCSNGAAGTEQNVTMQGQESASGASPGANTYSHSYFLPQISVNAATTPTAFCKPDQKECYSCRYDADQSNFLFERYKLLVSGNSSTWLKTLSTYCGAGPKSPNADPRCAGCVAWTSRLWKDAPVPEGVALQDPQSETYILSHQADDPNHTSVCGGSLVKYEYWVTSIARWGCTHLKISANGTCVIADVRDSGPNVQYELALGGDKDYGQPILDASEAVVRAVNNGSPNAGWRDNIQVFVEEATDADYNTCLHN